MKPLFTPWTRTDQGPVLIRYAIKAKLMEAISKASNLIFLFPCNNLFEYWLASGLATL